MQRGEAKVEAPAYRVSPVELRGVGGAAVAIAASEFHGLAVLADGSVLAWGANDQGQLGDGSKASRRRPVVVPGLGRVGGGVRGIFAGWSTSYAILGDGSVVGWGLNAIDLRGSTTAPRDRCRCPTWRQTSSPSPWAPRIAWP